MGLRGFGGRRGWRKPGDGLILAILALGSFLSWLFTDPTGQKVLGVAVLSLVSVGTLRFFMRERRRRRLQKMLASISTSRNRFDYVIRESDYRRGGPRESLYRKLFLLTLLSTYDNACAKCGTRSNGLDIDHFFITKNEGGCFIMLHVDGYLVNNAIPLCQTCNRSKQDRSIDLIFKTEELVRIFALNATMTRLLNEQLILDEHGNPIVRTRAALSKR
jgi:5-methylcytosine-specific restriction endonuclease McrA